MASDRHAVTAILIVFMVLPTGLMLLATLLGLRGSAAYTYLGVALVATAVAVLVQLVAAGTSVMVPLGVARSQSHYMGMYTFYPL